MSTDQVAANDEMPPYITDVVMETVRLMALQQSPTRALQEGEYFIKTLYSGISAGTELTFFLNTNPKASEGWDAKRRLFRLDMEPDQNDIYPKHEGYMESGVVTASRNQDFPVGMYVAGLWHHRDGHIATAGDYVVPLPNGFDPLLGIWVAKMGPISMNGILYAADEIRRQPVVRLEGSLEGQRVLVTGAGMIGLLCGVFARWAGAKEVAVVDAIAERLTVAEKLGMVPLPADPSMPVALKDRWPGTGPDDAGADIVLQCSGSDYLLHEAFSCLRLQGTVVDLGFYQQGAPQLLLGHEFHHNCLRHVCAQIGSVPRAQSESWNRRRLSEETIKYLQKHGEDLKSTLVSHIMPFSQSQDAFQRLANRDPAMLQVVLRPDSMVGVEA